MTKLAVFVRSGFPFNYDADAVSDATGLACLDESLAQQQFAEEVDINTIVRRFGLTGEMPDSPVMPTFGDFTDAVTDYQTALNMLNAAQDSFMQFPAEVRARFHNDPQEMMQFLDDEKNRDEAVKLGFIPKPPEKTRDAVVAIDELAAHFKNVQPVSK